MLNQKFYRKFEGSEKEGKGEVWMKTFKKKKQNQRNFTREIKTKNKKMKDRQIISTNNLFYGLKQELKSSENFTLYTFLHQFFVAVFSRE